MTNTNFKYFAFISYNARDTEWGKRLQRKLEHYRMPSTLCSERGWKRTPINPVFFAPSDIQPGGLTEELQERLKASRNLIVICSPNSAKSEWVGKEIEFFYNLGRVKDIHFFIVDGQPNSNNPENECFNPILKKLNIPEILGANIHEHIYALPWLNKERAYVQLISKLLGVEFDTIWKRHRRLLVQKVASWIVGVLVVLAALLQTYLAHKPIDVSISLKETVANMNIPPLKNAVVSLKLDNEIKTDTIENADELLSFTNIPHYFLGKDVNLSLLCKDFLTVDTIMNLSENMTITMYRNPDVYGNVRFKIWNPKKETVVKDVEIFIDGVKVDSDDDGVFSLFVPIENQKAKYHIVSSVPLENDTIYMPCGKNVYLRLKTN